jgi:hypothetical protein
MVLFLTSLTWVGFPDFIDIRSHFESISPAALFYTGLLVSTALV